MLGLLLSTTLFTACSGDDDSNNGSSYSTEEIEELLTGKWKFSGEFKINDPPKTKTLLSETYTGTIEFKANHEVSHPIKVDADINETNGDLANFLTRIILYPDNKYQILRKDGKNYIIFDETYKYTFEIIYLNKTTCYLVMDQDLEIVIYDVTYLEGRTVTAPKYYLYSLYSTMVLNK